MNYYEELGIKKTATAAEIKHAYRQLAKQYHPDKNPDNQQAANRFVKIATAYETLADKQQKKAYDARLFTATKQPKTRQTTTKAPPQNRNEFEKFFGFATGEAQVNQAPKPATTKTAPLEAKQIFEKFFKK